MARKATGEVVERERQRGHYFALRYRVNGHRRYESLGTAEEGWTRARAEQELEKRLAQVRLGVWQPPTPVVVQSREIPTFHAFASEWLAAMEPTLRRSTVLDYTWQISNHLLPFFADFRLDQIDVELVDRYRTAKVREGALSFESINKTITRLGQILEVAVEYRHIDRNPAAGKRRKLRAPTPTRTWLDGADQIEGLLNAAGELDLTARDGRAYRRVLLATLVFAGLRIGEVIALRWRDVDLAAGRITVGEAKTDAGRREIDLLPVLRDELAGFKARGGEVAFGDLVFPTSRGQTTNPSNVRNRVLTKAVERANQRRLEDDLAPLPEGLTPHSLRRTFCSLLLAIGVPPQVVMEQMGHTDPKLTLKVYAQVMRRSDHERERLDALVNGEDCAAGTRSARTHPLHA
jgi:integrase